MNKHYTSVITKLTRLLVVIIFGFGLLCAVAVYLYTDRTVVAMKSNELVNLHQEKANQMRSPQPFRFQKERAQ